MGDAFDQLRRGVARFERDVYDPASQRLKIALVKPEFAPVCRATLDKYIGREVQQKFVRRRFVEWDHEIHRSQRRDDFHSLGGWRHRAHDLCGVRKLLANARVALYGDR